jgi:cell filamentation protein
VAEDPYLDPRTGVLRNRLGLVDAEELRSAEADITAAELFRMEVTPSLGEGHFDLTHLRALHAQIFGEIYSWAGKLRTVDIAKEAQFCLAQHLEAFAKTVFEELAQQKFLVGLGRAETVTAVGSLYGQLNALHPFREGNGRAQRAFLSQLGVAGGWRLRWADLDPAANDEASYHSLASGDDSGLIEIIDELLEEVPKPNYNFGGPRRAVLVASRVAEELGAQLEDIRRGPYPQRYRCHLCRLDGLMAQESTVLLVEPLPRFGIRVVFAHARCGRSTVLPPVSARAVRARQQVHESEGEDATGVAILSPDGSAAFVWSLDIPVLGLTEADPVDPWLDKMLNLGFELTSTGMPPKDPTPGWHVVVRQGVLEVEINAPEGTIAYLGPLFEDEGAWVDAVAATGRCALLTTSRADLSREGLSAAAERGRLLVALATAVVEP